jgi:hypothetical protein
MPTFAKKGSQRWLQVAVERAPQVLDDPIKTSLGLTAADTIEWLSPLRHESFVEYRDDATFAKCGAKLDKRSLKDFWPQRGPMWDGLARTSRGDIMLIEAKAHIPELVSPRSRATEPAKGRIAKSVRDVQQLLSPKSIGHVDWTGTFYQYANRIAHLHFLRQDNGVRAHLVNVYFLNATDVQGPASKLEWDGALKVVESYLGVGRHRLSKYMHKVFVDAEPLFGLAQESVTIGASASPEESMLPRVGRE